MGLDVYDDIERCMSGGWSDGLPVIPPYGSLVDDMLAAMGWDYTEVVGSLPEQSIEVHASHVAAAAVMARVPPHGTVRRVTPDPARGVPHP